jgi:hypothetical protein
MAAILHLMLVCAPDALCVHLILVCVPDFSHHLNVCCYFAVMAAAAGLNVSCAQYKWLHDAYGVYDPIIL